METQGVRWFYVVPFDPINGHDHAGTGSYFPHLAAAIAWADGFRRHQVRKYSGHRRVLPTKIINVQHQTVAILGRGFRITWCAGKVA